MQHRALYSLIIMIVISGCRNNVQKKLISNIKDQCGDQVKPGCQITLNDAINFKWDKMYLFENKTTADFIAVTLGFVYNGDDIKDDYSRMIFTYDKKVVHEEEFKSLDSANSTIIFPGVSNSLLHSTIHYLTPSQASFKVEKDKIKNSCATCFNYVLEPATIKK
jgi:hypothetical protein